MAAQTKAQWVEGLYNAHATEVYRLALVILRDVHLAEDVLQETFLKVYQTSAPPRPGKERAWLLAVARNSAYDELRRRRRETGPEPLGEEPAPAWEYIDLLEGLSELERDIVSLHILGGLKHREVAALLGLTVHGEKKRYERALSKLRREMEETL